MPLAAHERDIPVVPVIYPRILARVLRRHGVSTAALLADTGIPHAALADPEAYLSIAQTQALIRRAQLLAPRPALGFEFGLALDLSAHGLLGFSVLRRASVRELTHMFVDYLRVRLPLMDIALQQHADRYELLITERWPLEDVREFVLEAYLGSMYALVAPAFRDICLCFARPRPDATPLPGMVHCPVRWGQPADCVLVWPARADALPLDLLASGFHADSAARAELATEAHYGITLRVRQQVMQDPGRHGTLDAVAEALGMSPRSLRRHLQADGVSFSEIRNDIRRHFAMRYLRGSRLTIEAIAERLGYGDQASFTRAFRDWTGTSPGRFRREAEDEARAALVPAAPGPVEPALPG